MKFLNRIYSNLNVVFVCMVMVVLVGAYSANAVDSSKSVIGYAWSSNIGWVSFNNGTVVVDDSGNLNGYAWSSNIGWVKFGGLSGFPDSSLGNNAKIVGTNLTGWARVVSVMNPLIYKTIDNRGGFDGWISLNSNGRAPAYGVTTDGTNFGGYSWGSDVVGWMNWDNVKISNTDDLCSSANGLLVDGETTSVTTIIASGADAGKCQTQQYICNAPDITALGAPSAPAACVVGADCNRDGITLENGESHRFYPERIVSGASCGGLMLTCSDGILVNDGGTSDSVNLYSDCLVAPNYTETQ